MFETVEWRSPKAVILNNSIMEKIKNLKRQRSSDPPYCLQSKKYIDQKFFDCRDDKKIKKVHDKTIDMLFKGAKISSIQLPPEDQKDLTKLLILSGDGEVDLLYHENPKDLSLERKKSKCCERDAFIDAPCTHCNVHLCEYCGYSCIGCGRFLCDSCITLFGCGTIDFPKCDNCALFE